MVTSAVGVLTMYRFRRSVAVSSPAITSGLTRKSDASSGYGSTIGLMSTVNVMAALMQGPGLSRVADDVGDVIDGALKSLLEACV